MVGSVDLLLDGQRPLQEWLRLAELPVEAIHDAQIVENSRDVRMVLAMYHLIDRQSPSIDRFRFNIPPLGGIDLRQLRERDRNPPILPTEGLGLLHSSPKLSFGLCIVALLKCPLSRRQGLLP
jgi:hypothetical protein